MTTAKKKLSARERYRQIKEKQTLAELAKPVGEHETLYDFTAPSGMEFKLRRPNVNLFINMGTLPMAISGKGTGKAEAVAMFKQMPPEKQARLIEQSANIVRFICVDPKIVDNPQADDEISPDDVSMEDFNALAEWAGAGGEAAGLSNFR